MQIGVYALALSKGPKTGGPGGPPSGTPSVKASLDFGATFLYTT